MDSNIKCFCCYNFEHGVCLTDCSITHHSNNDDEAQDVLLLCYPLVTDAKHILLCLERRFFADDHNGRITVSSGSTGSSGSTLDSPSGGVSHISFPSDGSPKINGTELTTPNSGGQGMSSKAQFDRVLSSFAVQARVIKLVRRWMQMYWKKDWENNVKLQDYCRGFGGKIRSAYLNEEDLEPSEMDKGRIYIFGLRVMVVHLVCDWLVFRILKVTND